MDFRGLFLFHRTQNECFFRDLTFPVYSLPLSTPSPFSVHFRVRMPGNLSMVFKMRQAEANSENQAV